VSGGIALDSYEAILRSERKVVRPGNGADSLLIRMVVHPKPERRMPPGGKALPEETVALLRTWIDTGAKEGTKPAEETVSVPANPARTRKLDVALPLTLAVPGGAFPGVAAGPARLTLPVGPLAPVTGVAFSPDGATLAAA